MPRKITKAVIAPPALPQPAASKLDVLAALLTRPGGATVAEMAAACGWQKHSVRGAMSGLLKTKRGLTITSAKADGVRVYSATRAEGAEGAA